MGCDRHRARGWAASSPPCNTNSDAVSKIPQVPLQPVVVGPLWSLGVSVPALSQDWPSQADLTQNAGDNGRINVPSPTIDLEFADHWPVRVK